MISQLRPPTTLVVYTAVLFVAVVGFRVLFSNYENVQTENVKVKVEEDNVTFPFSLFFERVDPVLPRALKVCQKLYSSEQFLKSLGLHKNLTSTIDLIFAENPQSGIADNVIGATTLFTYALASGRRFYIEWDLANSLLINGNESAFKFTFQRIFPQECTRRLCEHKNTLGHHLLDSYRSRFSSETKSIRYQTNRGDTISAFSNPNVPELTSLLSNDFGLTPWTTFGCLNNALFQVSPTLLRQYVHIHNLLVQPSHVVISLQIRTGDDSFAIKNINATPGEVVSKHTDIACGFLRCALKIYTETHQNKSLSLFLATDSIVVRHAMEDLSSLLPSSDDRINSILNKTTVISTTDQAVGHISQDKDKTTNSYAKLTSILDHHFLSYAQYFVVSKRSGFGITAAMRSLPLPHRIYGGTQCEELSIEYIGSYWAGL